MQQPTALKAQNGSSSHSPGQGLQSQPFTIRSSVPRAIDKDKSADAYIAYKGNTGVTYMNDTAHVQE